MCYHIKKEILIKQIHQVVLIADKLFKMNIIGMYLYGSYVLGRIYQNSDLDILIIIKEKIKYDVRKILTKYLLDISGVIGNYEKIPLEVTIVNLNDIIPLKFPPKYEYMYGEWLREEIESGNIPQPHYDPDLIILLWQARLHSIPLKGEYAEKVIPIIPNKEIQMAIMQSLPTLISNIKGDERNVLLTLSRMWFTLERQDICSKDVAAEWVISKLPDNLAPLMEMACHAYLGKYVDEWDGLEKSTILLVNFMKEKIESFKNN